MNKIFQSKIWLALLIILVCAIGVIYYFTSLPIAHQQPVAANSKEQNPTSATATTSVPLHVPVDIFHDSYKSSTITSSSTGTVLSLKIVDYKSINPVLDLYENNIKVGQVQSEGISEVSFSPNNQYVGFKTISHLGINDFGFGLYVVNLIKKTGTYIYPPDIPEKGVTAWPKDALLSLYIDSYTWEGDSVNMVLYFVSSDGYKYYRVSPEETWNYNLGTGKYTKLGT